MVIPVQMRHLNENVLAAITIETTGNQPGFHDIIRFCVLLLDNHLEPASDHTPFYFDIQPKRVHNVPQDYKGMSVSKQKLFEIVNETGLDPYTVADRFEEWHSELDLKFRKQIIPLTYNWPYVYTFLVDFLGWEHMHQYFAPQYRDLIPLAVMLNDRTNMRAESAPYPKFPLAYLASQLKVEHERNEDCIQRAYTISKIYKRMLQCWPL
jgi:hypothetical protein